MADGQVVFEITADGKKAISGVKDVTKVIQSETKKWDDAAEDAAGGAEDSWKLAVGKIAGALSAAAVVSTLTKWGKAAIDAASNLEEVQNVVDVTFGGGAAKIETWSKKAGKQFGLTETQAKKFTSTLGAMMKSAGLSGDEIVGMSTDLAGLAADMASFYNLDFETAFQKIRSGISGETEPLKQLGVNMSVANLEAFALEKGITKSFNAMSQGEQTLLRYQYLMQATADAQGDFARTSDGFANASRRMETALETIKTIGGEVLLEVVEPLVSNLASLMETLTTKDTTVLDEFAGIDKAAGEKVSRVHQTADDARLLADELVALGTKTNRTEAEQKRWLETCQRLVKTIPSLSSIINVETGEIKGGTQAVYDYVKAWEEGQTKLAMMGALGQKESALTEAASDLPSLELDAAVAARRVKKQYEALDAIRQKYGLKTNGYNQIIRTNATGGMGTLTAEEKEWNDAIATLGRLRKAQDDADAAYTKAKDAYEEAYEALKDYRAEVEEMPDGLQEATAKTQEWTDEQKKAGKAVIDALSAIAEYSQTVRDSTAQTVDGIVKGFNKLVRPTTELEEKRSKLIEQQLSLNRGTEEGKKKYQELQKQIDELNKSISEYNTTGMKQGLQSQLAFMNEYMDNLEKAKGMGLSNELLAYLSDGSVESAEYLANLVSNPEQAQEVDALFQEVSKKKSEFTDALTDQKLTVDETYQAMVDAASEAISNLDMGTDAKTAMGNTVEGIVSAIAEKVPEVQTAVDAILAQINRINGISISVSVGLPTKKNNKGPLDGEFESGLDYVPFDGFLAGLHQGEGILTAEENRIWQRFKNGGTASQNVDYDTLGATMRDNVKAGGNVYLDGRIVGNVISAQQGNSYRALQRSGWQQ